MGYFRYTKSEEELKEQYRRLLIKYNYKDERNKKVIDAITNEFNQMVQQARYDNGYRTFGQKIKEKAVDSYNEYKIAQEMEANRKSVLAGKAWTKQDLIDIIAEIKNFMRRTIPMQIRDGNETVIRNIKIAIYGSKRSKEIYDACTNNIALVSKEEAERIKRLKEKLEYCVFYLVGKDESKEETVLRELEEKLGKEAYSICLRYLPEDEDPIEGLKIRRLAEAMGGEEEKEEKSLKSANTAFAVLLSLPGVACLMFWFAYAFEMLSEDFGAFLEISSYIPLVIAIVWFCFIRLVWKGNKRRIERRNRIIGHEKNVQAHNQATIARLIRSILRLFGI